MRPFLILAVVSFAHRPQSRDYLTPCRPDHLREPSRSTIHGRLSVADLLMLEGRYPKNCECRPTGGGTNCGF
jgi:hypothetical protein